MNIYHVYKNGMTHYIDELNDICYLAGLGINSDIDYAMIALDLAVVYNTKTLESRMLRVEEYEYHPVSVPLTWQLLLPRSYRG